MTIYPPPGQPQQKSFLRDLLEIVVLALALYVIIQFAVQTVHVQGQSMEGTLQSNDFLLASKVDYKLRDPQRGDIVVFRPTNDAAHDYIKRIIAIPGDKLRIDHAQVYVNGHLLAEPYLPEKWTWQDTWNNGDEKDVPASQYFVMGDNRNHSTDSRFLGFQPRDHFLGRAWVRIWPLKMFKIFQPESHLAS